jgi:CheY-like chemotaxis protein
MPKTLLLADDSVTIQKVVGITFANEDIELVTVDNGTDALTRAKQIFPDLVLADIGMPGMDGYELCAAIRRYPELAHVPVLLLTGTFESYDEARARSVGASGHISKPFEAQALVDRVWELLAQAEASQGATRVADPLDLPAPVAAAPARMPPPPAPPPAAAPAEDPLADLPDLPNSNFSAQRTPPPPAPAPAGPRLPEPKASDLFDLEPTRPPLSPPLDEPPLARHLPISTAWSEPDPLDAADAEVPEGETAFLDPLHDLTPSLPRSEPRPAPAPGTALLPPAEAPDFLDLGRVDPQEDTNPTYADGSSIAGESDEPLDPRVASGESIALTLPEGEALAAARGGAGAAGPLVDAQPLPELDPLDLEPLEPADPHEATLRASHSTVPLPAMPRSAPATPPVGAAALRSEAGPAGHRPDADALHAALEKLAWEAFGSLSQELVEQFTRRLEAILWEVVPTLTERLVREEIARLKSEP